VKELEDPKKHQILFGGVLPWGHFHIVILKNLLHSFNPSKLGAHVETMDTNGDK
jgi:hypothetical protein